MLRIKRTYVLAMVALALAACDSTTIVGNNPVDTEISVAVQGYNGNLVYYAPPAITHMYIGTGQVTITGTGAGLIPDTKSAGLNSDLLDIRINSNATPVQPTVITIWNQSVAMAEMVVTSKTLNGVMHLSYKNGVPVAVFNPDNGRTVSASITSWAPTPVSGKMDLNISMQVDVQAGNFLQISIPAQSGRNYASRFNGLPLSLNRVDFTPPPPPPPAPNQ